MDALKLCIVSPCYNEEIIIENSAFRFTELLKGLISEGVIHRDSFVLFVNDGSNDETWNKISKLHNNNSFINGINLGINVGHQKALHAGLIFSKDYCDIVISIDVDIQDDLNAIPEMILKYRSGADIVYGIKVSRKADPFFKRFIAQGFYKFQKLMGITAIYNHADFRLMSKRALEQLSLYQERNIYLRGLIPQLGFPTATVDDTISKRSDGESKYSLYKQLNLALDGITSFSVKPVRFIFIIGIIMLAISLIATIQAVVAYFSGQAITGWTSIMLSIWFIGALMLISLGIIGEYIGKLYTETKNRPLYNIETILFTDSKTNKHKNDKSSSKPHEKRI